MPQTNSLQECSRSSAPAALAAAACHAFDLAALAGTGCPLRPFSARFDYASIGLTLLHEAAKYSQFELHSGVFSKCS